MHGTMNIKLEKEGFSYIAVEDWNLAYKYGVLKK